MPVNYASLCKMPNPPCLKRYRCFTWVPSKICTQSLAFSLITCIYSCVFKDIVLKHADSWTSLGKMATQTPCPIKSSKESFQQFRKVAMEKEERERARKLQMEAGREKSSTDKSGYKQNPIFQATQCVTLCYISFILEEFQSLPGWRHDSS